MTGHTTPPVFAGPTEMLLLMTLLLFSFFIWFFKADANLFQVEPTNRWLITIFSDPPQKIEINYPDKKHLTVTGKLGPAEIEWDGKGKVRIASSTCPCRTCTNMGWSADASLICVPNGIVVEPLRLKTENVDAVSR
jgi:hypothetical protein